MSIILRSLILLIFSLDNIFFVVDMSPTESGLAICSPPSTVIWGNTYADSAFAMDMSPDGLSLAVSTITGIYIYDPSTLELVQVVYCGDTEHPVSVRPLKWSQDGHYLAAFASEAEGIQVWDTTSWKISVELRGENDPSPLTTPTDEARAESPVRDLVWSPDSHYIAAIGSNSIPFRVWDVEAKTIVFTNETNYDPYPGGPYQPDSLAWSPDGNTLAYGYQDQVQFWETKTFQSLNPLNLSSSPKGLGVHSLSWSSSNFLAVGGWYSDLSVWDMKNLTPVDIPPVKAHLVSWLPGTQLLAYSADFPFSEHDVDVKIMDIASGQVIQELKGYDDRRVVQIAWNPNGKTLYTIEQVEESFMTWVVRWDLESGERTTEIPSIHTSEPDIKS